MINTDLVEAQKLKTHEIYQIGRLHVEEENLIEKLKTIEPGSYEYMFWLAAWHRIHFDLQDAWRFDRDKLKHPSWKLPGCLCPKMDNSDVGCHMYIAANCPIHGRKEDNGSCPYQEDLQ